MSAGKEMDGPGCLSCCTEPSSYLAHSRLFLYISFPNNKARSASVGSPSSFFFFFTSSVRGLFGRFLRGGTIPLPPQRFVERAPCAALSLSVRLALRFFFWACTHPPRTRLGLMKPAHLHWERQKQWRIVSLPGIELATS